VTPTGTLVTTIIVPTLNEEDRIEALVAALQALHGEKEIIIADGQSVDATVHIARNAGVRVVCANRGRGEQLHAAATIARGDVLWFLHADTIPSADALAHIAEALQDPRVVGGNFRLVFEGASLTARQMTWIYPRLRLLGLAYGDSGIFVRRSLYERMGGLRPYPLFEDLDLVRRLKPQGRFVHLDCSVVTSSRRFEGRNYPRAWATWIMLQMLYWMGVSPNRLARWYR
jgi:rSAM/selenodomain-associated transferase 2